MAPDDYSFHQSQVETKPVVAETNPAAVEAKPAVVTEAKPAVVTEAKPAVVTEAKPAVVTEAKPAVVTEVKAAVVSEAKPADSDQYRFHQQPGKVDSVAVLEKPALAEQIKPVTEVNETKPVTEVKEVKPVTEPAEVPVTEVKEKPADSATKDSPEAEKKAEGENTPEKTDDKPEQKKPKDVLLDPKASAEDKLKAAKEMAKNGESKFTGPDGRVYNISTQKYGQREGVVVSTNEKGKFTPVLRGIINKDGSVSQQTDSKGKAVDFAGDRAKKQLPNDLVMSTNKKDEPPKEKTDPKPDPNDAKKDEEPKPDSKDTSDPKKDEPTESSDPPTLKPEGELQKGPLGTEMTPLEKLEDPKLMNTSVSEKKDGERTHCGRPYDSNELTVAINPKNLPEGMHLRPGDVVELKAENGKTVRAVVTDLSKSSNLEVTPAVAKELGLGPGGFSPISVQKVGSENFRAIMGPKSRPITRK